MKLLETTTHELARAKPRLAFWPVGTIEPHDLGPLGTDVIAPQKLADDLAPRFDALLLPTLPFGLVSSLAGYPGAMWMSADTYHRLIGELLGSLSASSVERVFVFNGHGGNSGVLGAVLQEVWKTHRIKVASLDWWRLGQDLSEKHFGAAGGHGGADELALVRAASAELARPAEGWDGSRAFRGRPGVRAYPSPRSAIRHVDGEVHPLTAESADAYYTELLERIAATVTEVLAGWEAMEELAG